jgi:hypothetical protein
VPVHRAFILVSISRRPGYYGRYSWQDKSSRDHVVASDEALVEKVEPTPASSVWWTFIRFLEGVNVLRASGKLPLEPGYPLRGN